MRQQLYKRIGQKILKWMISFGTAPVTPSLVSSELVHRQQAQLARQNHVYTVGEINDL
ncbi:hypothetical protein [Periweissella cryptocerci]|uniref:hypothetical protein n=1 Tax=Periweissella cryptocerci TaxID=2506420 RepID=UPI0014054C3A|nr:hypothetical protein [Periweissella cryptocerci]